MIIRTWMSEGTDMRRKAVRMKLVSGIFLAAATLFGPLSVEGAAASVSTLVPGPRLDLVGKPCKQYAAPQLGGQWTLVCEGYKANSKSKQCVRWGLQCEPVTGTKP
jgi:hypothetical protein